MTIDNTERANVLAYLDALIDRYRAKSDASKSSQAIIVLDGMALALSIAHDDIDNGKHVRLQRARERLPS